MQTHEQVLLKIAELEKGAAGDTLYDLIAHEVTRLIRSGAINLEEYDDNFRLPKLLYSAALHRVADSYAPLSKEDRAVSRNLSHF